MSQGARALVVDDDGAIRWMVSTILEREGYEVDSAKDGYEAIELIRSNDYSLILLDLMMPRVDGFSVLNFLSSAKPLDLEHVVVMTALSAESVSRPVPKIIYKPFDMELLTFYAQTNRKPRVAPPLMIAAALKPIVEA